MPPVGTGTTIRRAVINVVTLEGRRVMNVLGIILTVTGVIALIVSLSKGPNLGISRRTGVTIGAVLLVIGLLLLVVAGTS
jgi:hypothetical protein